MARRVVILTYTNDTDDGEWAMTIEPLEYGEMSPLEMWAMLSRAEQDLAVLCEGKPEEADD